MGPSVGGAQLLPGFWRYPLHVGQDVCLDGADLGAVVPAHDGDTVGPHQELLEVPADVTHLHGLPEEACGLAHQLCGGRAGILQEREHLLLLVPIHIPFFKELELGDKAATRPDVLDDGQDL